MDELTTASINLPPDIAHRAFYFTVSKKKWELYQKREMNAWYNKASLAERISFVKQYYVPILNKYLQDSADDMHMLEIGSGPVCTMQHVEKGMKTYVDPLLNDFRRLFPGMMPEDAHYITGMAEQLKLPSGSFESIGCFDMLSDAHNPELVLSHIKSLLKEDGRLFVSMDLWPSLIARAHLWLAGFAPRIPGLNRLYCYTYRGFFHTLARHFDILAEHKIETRFSWLSPKREILFVCQPMKKQ